MASREELNLRRRIAAAQEAGDANEELRVRRILNETLRFEESLDPSIGVGPIRAAGIGVGRGLTTIGRGLGFVEPEDPAVTAGIEQLRERRPVATTGGEILGESAPFLIPGTAAGGAIAKSARLAELAKRAGTAGRVAGAAALGATEGTLISRGLGRTEGEQLESGILGGTVAGTAELVLPSVIRRGGALIRRVLRKTPEGAVVDAAGRPSQELLDALEETGQTFDELVEQSRLDLAGEAVDPGQVARAEKLREQGLEPLRAQITRDAADFQAQQEAAKRTSEVRDALEGQEAILTSRFDNAIAETGGQSITPTSTVTDALVNKATELDQEISRLYGLARETAPGAQNIRFQNLAEELRRLAPSNQRMGGNIRSILGDLQNRGVLDRNFKVTGRVDVDTAEAIRQSMNQLFDPKNDFANIGLRRLKEALDNDVFRAAGQDVFDQARTAKRNFEQGLSRAKISKFDSRKANLVRDVLENKIDPDRLSQDVVFSKKWRAPDLKQLTDYISDTPGGEQAFNDLRADVLNQIKERAFVGPADEAGFQALSRDKLEKALNAIGDKKLAVLFNPQERKFLNDMVEVAKIREPVRGTALGQGPSAQAVNELRRSINQLPFVGGLIDNIQLNQQGRAVLSSSPDRIVSPRIETAARVGTQAAVPAVAAGAVQARDESRSR